MHSNHILAHRTSGTALPSNRAASVGRPRLRNVVGGVVAVGALTFGIGAFIVQESAVQVGPAFADHAAIAERARADGLTGLSPASLSPSPAHSDASLAKWARANGMTGLSPASLASTATAWPRRDDGAIADWGGSNGLTGLSPASPVLVAD